MVSINLNLPGSYGTGNAGTGTASDIGGQNGFGQFGDLSGNGGLQSPFMQKFLALFQALVNDILKQSGAGQTDQPPAPTDQLPDPASTPPGPTQTPPPAAQGSGGGQGAPEGTPTNVAPGGTTTPTSDNPLEKLGADSAGANADGQVSQSEEGAYQTTRDDMDHADKLSKQIAADPTQATEENLGMLTDLNTKILKELPTVSVDAMRQHREEIKPLMANYQTDIDTATKAADPNSLAGAALGVNDAAASIAINSKFGTWGAANQRDGIAGSDDSGQQQQPPA